MQENDPKDATIADLAAKLDRLIRADSEARERWAKHVPSLAIDYTAVGGGPNDCDGFRFPDAYAAGDHMAAELSDLAAKLKRAVEVVRKCERAGDALAPVCPMCRANPWEMAPHDPTCPLAAVLKENP